MNKTYIILPLSHLHHPDPLVASGMVPDMHDDVGVEAEHDQEWDHKNNQEDSREVNFLQGLGPSTEVTDTLFLGPNLVVWAIIKCLERDIKDEVTRKRGEQRGDPSN
jgi:hypothetical protein